MVIYISRIRRFAPCATVKCVLMRQRFLSACCNIYFFRRTEFRERRFTDCACVRSVRIDPVYRVYLVSVRISKLISEMVAIGNLIESSRRIIAD